MEFIKAQELAESVRKAVDEREKREYEQAKDKILRAIEESSKNLKFFCTVGFMPSQIREELVAAGYKVERALPHEFASASTMPSWRIFWDV